MLRLFCLVALFVPSFALYYQNELITLTPDNFESMIISNNIFVSFIFDFLDNDKFIELLKEIKNVANEAEDLESRLLKFGIFDCKLYVMKCKELGIGREVEIKFYGAANKWPELTEFLHNMVFEVNQENELISALDGPGRFLVLFKVVYCPYCEETLKEWPAVEKYFENNEDIKIHTLDCTRRRPICHRFDVTRYPKIKFIYNTNGGKQEVYTFAGDRVTDEIVKYAKDFLHATGK